MILFISIVFFIFPSVIQCQSGGFAPSTGRIDSLDHFSYYRMITEFGCVSICLQYTSPACYAISYENFREECRIITEPIPALYTPDQLLPNWRSYIRSIDSS